MKNISQEIIKGMNRATPYRHHNIDGHADMQASTIWIRLTDDTGLRDQSLLNGHSRMIGVDVDLTAYALSEERMKAKGRLGKSWNAGVIVNFVSNHP